MVLLDSDGNVLAGAGDRNIPAGDWSAQLAGYVLPSDGRYQIAVTHYAEQAGFQITVTYSVR